MQINLLKSLPKTFRNRKLLEERKLVKSRGDDAISRLFGHDYFDGSRAYGYNGYYYDGRWIQVAKDIIKHYDLHPGARILDVGAAKGFLVYDLYNQGMDAYGIDVSRYAVKKCQNEIIGRMHRGDVLDLPFADSSFDLVLSINCIHNIESNLINLAISEIMRVSRGNCFIQVDAYRTEQERKDLEDWILTARIYGTPEEWLEIFSDIGYNGDYDWTIHEFEP